MEEQGQISLHSTTRSQLVVGQPFPPFRGALVLAAPKPVRDHQLTTSVVKEKKKKNWRMLLGSQLLCLRKWVFMLRPAQVSGNLFLVYIYMHKYFSIPHTTFLTSFLLLHIITARGKLSLTFHVCEEICICAHSSLWPGACNFCEVPRFLLKPHAMRRGVRPQTNDSRE